MKQDKFLLTDNHKRSLSSTLRIVEQLLIDIEDLMVSPNKAYCFIIDKDLDRSFIDQNLKVIEEARNHIYQLTEKYGTIKSSQSLKRVIDVKKTRIWEILCDSKSKKLKGFGDFPSKSVKEYDDDIDELITITDKLKF